MILAEAQYPLFGEIIIALVATSPLILWLILSIIESHNEKNKS
jgi:hypothetical protein